MALKARKFSGLHSLLRILILFWFAWLLIEGKINFVKLKTILLIDFTHPFQGIFIGLSRSEFFVNSQIKKVTMLLATFISLSFGLTACFFGENQV